MDSRHLRLRGVPIVSQINLHQLAVLIPPSIRIVPFVNLAVDSSRLFQAYRGRTDGEGMETAWANQSPHLPSRVRSMPAGERRLDEDYTFFNNMKAQLAGSDDGDDEMMPELESVESVAPLPMILVCFFFLSFLTSRLTSLFSHRPNCEAAQNIFYSITYRLVQYLQ